MDVEGNGNFLFCFYELKAPIRRQKCKTNRDGFLLLVNWDWTS